MTKTSHYAKLTQLRQLTQSVFR